MFNKQMLPELAELIREGYRSTPTIDINGTQILIDKSDTRMVITVVGTNEKLDWKRNLDARFVRASQETLAEVHAGFNEAADVVITQLLLCAGKPTNPRKIYINGHSQGAAVAQLLALRMHRYGYNIAGVCLWADPRVGDQLWVDNYNLRLADKTLHIIRAGDPVPLVPFSMSGYRRTGGLVHYWKNGVMTVGSPSLKKLWANTLWLWIKWRMKGNLDFASDDYHSYIDYTAPYMLSNSGRYWNASR